MSLLLYFLHKTHAPEKFESVTKYMRINKNPIKNLQIGDPHNMTPDESFELGHKIYKNGPNIMYETFFSNGNKIVKSHLSTHTANGNISELLTYCGDDDKFDNTLDVCYVIDIINETLATHSNCTDFWDEIIVNPDDLKNISSNICTSGFLISKDKEYNPKKIEVNGKIICDMLGSDLEVCYVDYLKYSKYNVLIYCQKYDIGQELSNNCNESASNIAKRKIVGHCILVSNDCDVDEKYMAQIIVSALNFNQKKYEDMQKRDLLKMYMVAHVIQNPR